MAEKRVMLITGTSRGIGRSLAEYYAAKKWLVSGCSRSESDFSHQNYNHRKLDVTDEDQVVHWIRDIFKTHGRIDALINNAGAASMNHALLTPGKTIDRLLNLNVKGTIIACREAAKIMQKGKFGRIINFSSIAVSLALEGESVYVATKGAVESYSRVLARELAPWNITVNVIAPSPMKTDLTKKVPEKKLQGLLKQMVIQRFGTFEEIIHVLDFFLSKTSSAITGQIITLGGW